MEGSLSDAYNRLRNRRLCENPPQLNGESAASPSRCNLIAVRYRQIAPEAASRIFCARQILQSICFQSLALVRPHNGGGNISRILFPGTKSGTNTATTPPKYSKARTCEVTHDSTSWPQLASA